MGQGWAAGSNVQGIGRDGKGQDGKGKSFHFDGLLRSFQQKNQKANDKLAMVTRVFIGQIGVFNLVNFCGTLDDLYINAGQNRRQTMWIAILMDN